MTYLSLDTDHTGEPPNPLEEALEGLRKRLGAERWVLCRLDGGQWSTQALPALPRDHVYLIAMETFEAVDEGWAAMETSEIPGSGPRLQVAGVARLAVLRSTLRRGPAFAVFENPVAELEGDVFVTEIPEQLGDQPSAVDQGALADDDRWDHEMHALWELLPALGLFAGGQADEEAAAQRTAQALDARALVALTPTATGISVVAAVKEGTDWNATSCVLEGESWEIVTDDPVVTLDRALKEACSGQVLGPWAVSWGVGNRLFMGVAPGGKRPSQEGLDIAATLLGWGFGQAEGNAAAGQHALLRERSRIASAIHEGLTQVVTNVAIQLQVLERYLGDPEKAAAMVEASREAVTQALDDLRGAIFELAPRETGSDDLAGGLVRYVDDFGAQWGLEVDCDVEGTERPVDPDIVALMFAFVQEGLTNVRKHAQSTSATIMLEFTADGIKVQVSDQGEGFDPSARDDEGFRKHQGLNLLRSRVWLMGGRIDVVSSPGQGTSLVMEISS
ncbi:MAG: hypothetical protein GEU71_04420 [Actinobacteria bacterium]|nr:hypothetical protein [Actinomycetota bacterium]